MAEIQEMSELEKKVAQQIEVYSSCIFKYGGIYWQLTWIMLISPDWHVFIYLQSTTSVITTFQETSSSKNSCSSMMAGWPWKPCSSLTGLCNFIWSVEALYLVRPTYMFIVHYNIIPNFPLIIFRLKCLTTDHSVIVESLKKSQTGLLELSEDKTKIRRISSKPLPELNDKYKDTLKHKSVYIVGWIFQYSRCT